VSSLFYIDLVPSNIRAAFAAKTETVAAKLRTDANALMCVMYLESKLNPQSVNMQPGDVLNPYERALKRAVGLIQWMPDTLADYGLTGQDVYNMDALEQLDLVYRYLKPYTGQMNTLFDVYFAVFFPKAIGKPGTYVLSTPTKSAAVIASQNSGYDVDKNLSIQRWEVEQTIIGRIRPMYVGYFEQTFQTTGTASGSFGFAKLLGLLLGALLLSVGTLKLLKTIKQ
jgi:hypothetical protein